MGFRGILVHHSGGGLADLSVPGGRSMRSSLFGRAYSHYKRLGSREQGQNQSLCYFLVITSAFGTLLLRFYSCSEQLGTRGLKHEPAGAYGMHVVGSRCTGYSYVSTQLGGQANTGVPCCLRYLETPGIVSKMTNENSQPESKYLYKSTDTRESACWRPFKRHFTLQCDRLKGYRQLVI